MRVALVLTLAATPAFAMDIDSWETAGALGRIIGSESACGLTLDQGRIANFVAINVAPADLEFPNSLGLFIRSTGREITKMSPSAKVAHCTAITISARFYGLAK